MRTLHAVVMRFAYYQRLSPRGQAIYRLSDSVRALRLYRPSELWPLVSALRAALELTAPDAEAVREAVLPLTRAVTERLGAPPVAVEVLEVRPRGRGAELHGLYTRLEDATPLVLVWMRTARRGRPVAFRTFLRTVVHELCHHLDVELLGLPESFHTAGFYGRESSLVNQLAPPPSGRRAAKAAEGSPGAAASPGAE